MHLHILISTAERLQQPETKTVDMALVTVTGTGVTYYGRVCVSGVVTYLQHEGFLARLFGKLLQHGLNRQVWALPIDLQQTDSLQTFLRH